MADIIGGGRASHMPTGDEVHTLQEAPVDNSLLEALQQIIDESRNHTEVLRKIMTMNEWLLGTVAFLLGVILIMAFWKGYQR